MVDIGLGFIPVVGEARDIYELVSGKNLITGEELTATERAMAAFGVVTAGAGPTLVKVGKWTGKIARDSELLAKAVDRGVEIQKDLERAFGKAGGHKAAEAIHQAARTTGRQAGEIINDVTRGLMPRIGDLKFKVDGVTLRWADERMTELKKSFKAYEPAYKAGSMYAEGTLKEESQNLVRVFSSTGDNKEVGKWVVDRRVISKDGALLSGHEIQKKLNLPGLPDRLVPVELPSGTQIRLSEVGRNSWGASEGALQIEILSETQIHFFKSDRIEILK